MFGFNIIHMDYELPIMCLLHLFWGICSEIIRADGVFLVLMNKNVNESNITKVRGYLIGLDNDQFVAILGLDYTLSKLFKTFQQMNTLTCGE